MKYLAGILISLVAVVLGLFVAWHAYVLAIPKQPTVAVDAEISAEQYKSVIKAIYMVAPLRDPIANALLSDDKITQSEYAELEQLYIQLMLIERMMQEQEQLPGNET